MPRVFDIVDLNLLHVACNIGVIADSQISELSDYFDCWTKTKKNRANQKKPNTHVSALRIKKQYAANDKQYCRGNINYGVGNFTQRIDFFVSLAARGIFGIK